LEKIKNTLYNKFDMKPTTCFLMFALGLIGGPLLAQTPQNTDPSAALEVNSTTKGFLPPRMSNDQREAIPSPTAGLTIYNTDTNTLDVFTGFEWKQLGIDVDTVVSVSGKTWMDRNLGATQVATSSTDADAYGWRYQWGRNTDGHQEPNSSTATGPVASGSEGSNFITSNDDWLSAPNNTRWNGATKGTHDPCPNGFRVPTESELEKERLLFPTQDADGAFASVLKLPVAGYRNGASGALESQNVGGYYWTSKVDGTNARALNFDSSSTLWESSARASGFTVRCIQE
jgi:hypothetical protein